MTFFRTNPFNFLRSSTVSDGEINLWGTGSTGTGATWYMDYIYANDTNAKIDYITNSEFSAVTGTSADNWSV